MRVVCCICNKVKTNNGWRPGQVRAKERPSHGFCPSCHRRMLNMIMAHATKSVQAGVSA